MDKNAVVESVKKQIEMDKPVIFVDIKAWPEHKAAAIESLSDAYMPLETAVNTPTMVVFARKKVFNTKK
jgi:hypothetical protein